MVELLHIRAKQSATHVYNKKEKAAAICRRPGVNLLLTLYRKGRKLSSIIMSICTWPAYFTCSVLEPTASNISSLLPSATSISFTFSSCLRRSNLSGAYVDGIYTIANTENRNYITNGNRGKVACERKLHTIDGTYLWMKAKIAAWPTAVSWDRKAIVRMLQQ